jgi:hypothetical protein
MLIYQRVTFHEQKNAMNQLLGNSPVSIREESSKWLISKENP